MWVCLPGCHVLPPCHHLDLRKRTFKTVESVCCGKLSTENTQMANKHRTRFQVSCHQGLQIRKTKPNHASTMHLLEWQSSETLPVQKARKNKQHQELVPFCCWWQTNDTSNLEDCLAVIQKTKPPVSIYQVPKGSVSHLFTNLHADTPILNITLFTERTFMQVIQVK